MFCFQQVPLSLGVASKCRNLSVIRRFVKIPVFKNKSINNKNSVHASNHGGQKEKRNIAAKDTAYIGNAIFKMLGTVCCSSMWKVYIVCKVRENIMFHAVLYRPFFTVVLT